jgi:cobalt-zinc-cadmium efflux system protein
MSQSGAKRRARPLSVALGIAVGLLVFEVVGGFLSHSLALLADAGHLLTDVAALTLSSVAAWIAGRSSSEQHTFGLQRAEILAAFINAQVLLMVCLGLLWEAWRRISDPRPVHPALMALVSGVALAGNLLALRTLHPHQGHNLNLRGAYLEVAADALSSGAVLAAALLISLTGLLWIDPVVSAAIALLILPRTISLLRQSAHILLEGAPLDIDQESLTRSLAKLPGVASIHDLHIWTLTSGVHCASLHASTLSAADPAETLERIQHALQDEGHIEHATIQLEPRDRSECETLECR